MGLIVCCNRIKLSSLRQIKQTTDVETCLKTLNSLSSDLHRQGVGVVKQSAKVIEMMHEDMFWQKGVLGYSSPKIL